MSTIPTPAQAKPIGDFGHGSFDGSSKLFQSNSGSNSYVEGGDVGNYVNGSMLYPSLDNSTPIGAINALKGDIAPGYEESATSYDAGEYVIFEGVLYRCNTAITAPAGTFNSSLWDVATVAEFMDVANLPTATVDSSDVLPFIDVSDSNKPKSTTAAAVAALFNTYSTTERVVGEWIDGKTVYEQIVDVPMPTTANTMESTPHNIANIDTLVSYFAFDVYPNGTIVPMPTYLWTSGGQSASFYASLDKTNTNILCGADRTGHIGRFFIRYTKTTV